MNASFIVCFCIDPVQIPIFEVRSDGRDNFLGALIVAGHYIIPEVIIRIDDISS